MGTPRNVVPTGTETHADLSIDTPTEKAAPKTTTPPTTPTQTTHNTTKTQTYSCIRSILTCIKPKTQT